MARRAALILSATVSFSLAVALLFVAGLPEPGPGASSSDSIRAGVLAPDTVYPTLSGGVLDLRTLQGAPVIVNFWATWCIPCKVEMPELQSLYAEYADEGLRILAVNLGESQDDILDWVVEFGLTFDILMDRTETAERLYRFPGPPVTFVIDPDGVILQAIYGPATVSQLRTVIEPYLS